MPAELHIAVLDDYQSLSNLSFERVARPHWKIAYLPETLPAFHHASATSSSREELIQRLQPFSVICTMRERTPFPAELINALPSLKVLLTTGMRNRAIDLEACRARGIVVAGTGSRNPGETGVNSTLEHCVTMIMALARDVVRDDQAVKAGLWQTGVATGLGGKVFGVVGLGRLGADVARVLAALGMNVIAWSENLTQERADEKAVQLGLSKGVFKVVSRGELFETADVVSVHLVLSDRTRGLIKRGDLESMKKSSLFVNTARGPIVVEQDLLDALEAGSIRGAALDVFDTEPLPLDSPWRTTKWGEEGRSRVLLTPHVGYVEEGTMRSWYDEQVENVRRWEDGQALTCLMI